MTGPEARRSLPATTDDFSWISYEEFGARFFRRAVTAERISSAIGNMAGRGIKIGPLQVAGGLAGFVATGNVGEPIITPHESDDVAYDMRIPVSLTVAVRLGSEMRVQAGIEIDLVLHARAAAPLLIVIDIPAISERDVRLVLRAQTHRSAWEKFLEPIGRSIRREVAVRLNAMISDPAAVQGRVFDIGARIDDVKSPRRTSADFDWIGYGDFGREFFRHALTVDRISSAVKGLDGRTIDIDPFRTGPGERARVSATGTVGAPDVALRPGELIGFDLRLPVTLDLLIELPRPNRYRADIEVPLRLTARAADPLLIVMDVAPVSAAEIELALEAKGLGAKVVGALGGVRKQIRDQVASVVRKEIADPSGRCVDVGAQIDSA